MKYFMNRYFSIVFMFVVAASFVACNYVPSNKESVDTSTIQTIESQGPDSTVILPFDIDSIKTINQLLDSLDAVQAD